jgi:hypothetical protein
MLFMALRNIHVSPGCLLFGLTLGSASLLFAQDRHEGDQVRFTDRTSFSAERTVDLQIFDAALNILTGRYIVGPL